MTSPSGRVVVFGSANVDRTMLIGRPPGPGETIMGAAAPPQAGGKGLNQAVAAARVGAAVALHACVGAGGDGEFLLERARIEDIDVSAVELSAGATGLAVILLEPDGANRIVVAPGANADLEWTAADSSLAPTDVIVAQLEVPDTAVRSALAAGRRRGATTVLNAAPARPAAASLLDVVDVLVVNEPELEAMGGWSSMATLTAACATVIVTQGADGATVATSSREPLQVAAETVDVVDTTGAGDCFVGVLAAALSVGAPVAGATVAANGAAGLAVGRSGAADAMPTAAELGSLLPPALRVPTGSADG